MRSNISRVITFLVNLRYHGISTSSQFVVLKWTNPNSKLKIEITLTKDDLRELKNEVDLLLNEG